MMTFGQFHFVCKRVIAECVEKVKAGVFVGGQPCLQWVEKRNQFIDFGDDAELLGQGWEGNDLVVYHLRKFDLVR